MNNTYRTAVILFSAYISMILHKSIMNHTDANIGLAAFVMLFMFVILYTTLYWIPSKVYGWFKKSEVYEEISVIFKKHDGSYLSVGVPLELMEL